VPLRASGADRSEWARALPGSDRIALPGCSGRLPPHVRRSSTRFLDGNEASEQPYHAADPAERPQRTSELIRRAHNERRHVALRRTGRGSGSRWPIGHAYGENRQSAEPEHCGGATNLYSACQRRHDD
jgi:hypothetical protein